MLDTTYLLPVIGIFVKQISQDSVRRFRVNVDRETAICETTIFELSAKGAKYVRAGLLDPEQVFTGIKAILNDDSLVKLAPYDDRILSTAFNLRGMLNDFIDCLILSTALNQTNALLTEDGDIHDLKHNGKYKELVRATNPKFEIRRLSQD